MDGTLVASRAPDPGPVALGPLEVELDVRTGDGGTVMRWSVANRADTDVTVRSVAAVYAVDAAEPVRMLRHGYQSWSPTGIATLGHDADPSTSAPTSPSSKQCTTPTREQSSRPGSSARSG